MKLKTLDLFAGIGGIALGLERTGLFEAAAFCEIDPKAQAVLRKHWPDVPIFDDVSTLTKDDLPDIDVITGGFPCQDISLAGKGAGLAGGRSGLWFEFLRLIAEIGPKGVLIENVSALRSRGLDEVLRGLAEIGYDAEWHSIPAAAIGAPHRRDRLWLLAWPWRLPDASGGRLGRAQEGQVELARGAEALGPGHHVSDAQGVGRCEERADTGGSGEGSGAGSWPRPLLGGPASAWSVSDTDQPGLEGRHGEILRERAGEQSARPLGPQELRTSDWWVVEPDVGRVAHGVRGRVDRLKQLGNAVVPQVVEALGSALHRAAHGL